MKLAHAHRFAGRFPLSKPWIRHFEAAGGTVTSELELACACLEKEKLVVVTGSWAKAPRFRSWARLRDVSPGCFRGWQSRHAFRGVRGGCVGRSSGALRMGGAGALSSYQLERARNLRAIVVMASLLQNHMERYPNLEAYYETKWALLKKATRGVVLNENGGDLRAFASTSPAGGSLPRRRVHRVGASEKSGGIDFSRGTSSGRPQSRQSLRWRRPLPAFASGRSVPGRACDSPASRIGSRTPAPMVACAS